MNYRVEILKRIGLGLLLSLGQAGRAAESEAAVVPTVAVVRSCAWAQGDPAREGAAELAVLIQIARLQHNGHKKGGLIAVGDRRGLFSSGAEEALCQAVRQGVPVVKLADKGRVLRAPHDLFLDGGNLTEAEASNVLAQCLERYGALPTEVTPQRERLHLFQQEFILAASMRVVAR